MKPFFAISWLLGLGLAVALVVIQGAGTIAETLASAGWGILWICLFRLAPLGCAAIAWGLLIERPSRPPATFVFIARWIGESINNLLPVAQVGGDVIRVRLLTHQGVQASVAAASVIGDVTAGLLSELVFAAAGFVLLLERRGVESWGGVLVCLIVLGCLVASLIAAQVSGIVRPILRRFGGLLRSRMRLALEAGADTLQSELSALYARRGAFAACSCWRILGWTLGAAEVWLALWFLGHPVSILDALMLESLSQALRTVAFFVPGALGIQEGGFVLLGTAAGLGPEVSLSLSLMKRARELVLGVPGLVAWQLLEARGLARGFEGYAPSTKRKVG